MAINSVCIAGNITRDPELKNTASSHVLVFTVAVNERRKEGDKWVDSPVFVECEMWGTRAESLAKFLAKGMKVTVQGSLRYHSWQAKDGSQRSRVTVNVRDVDLPPKAKQPATEEYPF